MAQGRHGVLMRISTVADAHLLIHGRGDRVERRRPAVPLRARARNKATLLVRWVPLPFSNLTRLPTPLTHLFILVKSQRTEETLPK